PAGSRAPDAAARSDAPARARASSSCNASGAPVVGFFTRGCSSEAGGASGSTTMPSRTVITFAQFLQRILRILPRTRSSPIEYRVLQRSHRNFTPCYGCAGNGGRRRGGSGLRGATRALIVPKKTWSGKAPDPTPGDLHFRDVSDS